ncbi:hypothetical protein ABPG75_005858 [Micractinium tetrahymenae]
MRVSAAGCQLWEHGGSAQGWPVQAPQRPLLAPGASLLGMCAPLEDAKAVGHMLTSSWLNLLLVFLPIGLWAGLSGGNPSLVFTANFLALIPLVLFLGEVTEDLAARFGDTVGGLLNATFGNVVELVLSMSALRRGLYEVVAASLLGSILSNQLLVLGTCFFVGGIKYKEQRFSTFANKVSSSLLFLACIGILIHSTARMVYGKHVSTGHVLLNRSHVIALLLVGIYLCYLFFQLNTHVDLFQGEGEEEEVPALSLSGAMFCLTAITLIVTACSGGQRQQRHQRGLPGPHRAAHHRQRGGARHGGVCGGEEQDGPEHRCGAGLLHPGGHLHCAAGGADWLGHGHALHPRFRPLLRPAAAGVGHPGLPHHQRRRLQLAAGPAAHLHLLPHRLCLLPGEGGPRDGHAARRVATTGGWPPRATCGRALASAAAAPAFLSLLTAGTLVQPHSMIFLLYCVGVDA